MANQNLIPISPNCKNLIGTRVGRWVVVGYVGKSYWLCRCDCGQERKIFTGSITARKSLSCGCLRDELASLKNGTHRLTGTAEYKVWAGMKRRCNNKNEKAYKDYGAKGIAVCQRWSDSFEAFLADMGHRPSDNHEIDRIDNSKGYEPGNCRWVERIVQANNKSSNRVVEHDGRSMTIAQWSRVVGIGASSIQFRLSHGWSVEKALNTPAKIGRNQFD